VAPASRACLQEDPQACQLHRPSGDRPFRFGRGRGQNRENERIHFAKRNEAFRLAGHKRLKSLRAANHDFAGPFVFNGLSAVSFAVFSHGGCCRLKAERQPELSEQTGRILYFRLIIQLILFYTRNCYERGRCEGLPHPCLLPTGGISNAAGRGSGNSGEGRSGTSPIPLRGSLSPSALTKKKPRRRRWTLTTDV
jgi:hypothetical protein